MSKMKFSENDETPEAAPRQGAGMDPMLRLAGKLDRLLSKMPREMQLWALAWLQAKYVESEPKQFDPCA
jgi:hypothetical protein